MDAQLLRSLFDELQKHPRMLLQQVSANDEGYEKMTDSCEPELEEAPTFE
jgi:hypothetical protein